jgi:hypothetical protein
MWYLNQYVILAQHGDLLREAAEARRSVATELSLAKLVRALKRALRPQPHGERAAPLRQEPAR